jgi:hypothetical protein
MNEKNLHYEPCKSLYFFGLCSSNCARYEMARFRTESYCFLNLSFGDEMMIFTLCKIFHLESIFCFPLIKKMLNLQKKQEEE